MCLYPLLRHAVVRLLGGIEVVLAPLFPNFPRYLTRFTARLGVLRRDLARRLYQVRLSWQSADPAIIDELATVLSDLGISSGDNVLLLVDESKITGARPVPKSGAIRGYVLQERLLDRLSTLVGESGLLAMPCDSVVEPKRFSHERRVYDQHRSRARGLAGRFQRRSGVYRSAGPLLSLAAYGLGAEDLMSGHLEAAPFPMGPGSPWEKLLQRQVKVVVLGWEAVPNIPLLLPSHMTHVTYPRPAFFHRPFSFRVRTEDGRERETTFHIHACPFHPDYDLAAYADFTRFGRYIESNYQLYRRRSVGQLQVAVFDYRRQYEVQQEAAAGGRYLEDARYWDRVPP